MFIRIEPDSDRGGVAHRTRGILEHPFKEIRDSLASHGTESFDGARTRFVPCELAHLLGGTKLSGQGSGFEDHPFENKGSLGLAKFIETRPRLDAHEGIGVFAHQIEPIDRDLIPDLSPGLRRRGPDLGVLILQAGLQKTQGLAADSGGIRNRRGWSLFGSEKQSRKQKHHVP